MEAPVRGDYLPAMDSETRDAITTMGDTILARMDHYFELQQKQFLEWRAELRGDMHEMRTELRADIADLRERVDSLTGRVDSLAARVTGLEHEVARLRDYITREIADIKLELRELRGRSGQTDEIRREIAELTVRVDRLERRQPD
jgi:predicted RNase H-like nuclease (RuvC/YqgF family)